MNRKLLSLGFLRMLSPPKALKPVTDPAETAKLDRLFDDLHWRAYDRPAQWRFKSDRPKKQPKPIVPSNVVQFPLPSILRRQAE